MTASGIDARRTMWAACKAFAAVLVVFALGTHFWVDPEQQIVGILMAQHLSPIALLDEISGEFETAVMQALVAAER